MWNESEPGDGDKVTAPPHCSVAPVHVANAVASQRGSQPCLVQSRPSPYRIVQEPLYGQASVEIDSFSVQGIPLTTLQCASALKTTALSQVHSFKLPNKSKKTKTN